MVISYVKKLIDKWKVFRILKKFCYNTINDYNRTVDPLINRRSNTIKEFYHGYPYIAIVYMSKNYNLSVDQLGDWCKLHCKNRWRTDWHRSFRSWGDTGSSVVDVYDEINALTGIDFMVFAFVNEKDYNWFILSHNIIP